MLRGHVPEAMLLAPPGTHRIGDRRDAGARLDGPPPES